MFFSLICIWKVFFFKFNYKLKYREFNLKAFIYILLLKLEKKQWNEIFVSNGQANTIYVNRLWCVDNAFVFFPIEKNVSIFNDNSKKSTWYLRIYSIQIFICARTHTHYRKILYMYISSGLFKATKWIKSNRIELYYSLRKKSIRFFIHLFEVAS
jgi:hypothetical protein